MASLPFFVAGVRGGNLAARIEEIVANRRRSELTRARRAGLVLGVITLGVAPVVAGALLMQPPAQRQEATAPPLPPLGEAATFEVVSVRTNTSGGFTRSGTQGRTYTATNVPLRSIIANAYGIGGPQSFRLVGGPAWIGDGVPPFLTGDHFDIVATLPEGATVRQVPAMLRALLADRYKLVVHTEIREAPMYALVMSRGDGRLGPRLRRASFDCQAATAAGEVIPPARPGERGVCDSEIGGTILGRGQRLTSLARMLSPWAGGRQIIDRTGLTDAFDFDLQFPELNAGPAGAGPAGDGGGGVFTALQEQLGLKLESIRGPLEFVVIDSVEHPSEN